MAQIDRKKFLDALRVVAPAISARSYLPILHNVLLADGKIAGTDMELAIQVEAEVGGLAITLPAKLLTEMVASMSSEVLDIEGDDKQRVTLTSGSSQFTLVGLPADEFPVVDFAAKTESEMESGVLRDIARFCLPAASDEQARAILCAVNFTKDSEGRFAALGTDTHRLSLYHPTGAIEWLEGIVPSRTILLAARMFQGTVRVGVSDSHVQFATEGLTLISRLIEGQFPNFERVLPGADDRKGTITCDREEIINAIRRVNIVARTEAAKVVFRFPDSMIQLSAESAEGMSAKEQLNARMEGECLEQVAFNATYLLDGLHGLPESDEVELRVGGSNLLPAELRIPKRDDYRYIIMPMQVD